MTNWLERWHTDPESFIGATLDVCPVGESKSYKGKIIRLEQVHVFGETYDGYPIIQLDNGRRIGGAECWWTLDEGETA